MLTRIILASLSMLLLVSCKLHVNVSGLESELTLIEVNSGATITLIDNELVAFDHDFDAMDYFKVEIDKSSGQKCHLVYKSGRFTTPYTEMEVNCQPITDTFSCSTDIENICARVDDLLDCNLDEPCLGSTYQTFFNKCEADTSGLNPIFIGLDECSVIDTQKSTNDAPAIFVETPIKNADINVLSAEFDGDYVTVTFEHQAKCASNTYNLNVNYFAEGATKLDWAITYDYSCATLATQSITFDLMPIRDWYSQQNGGTSGSIELPSIGTYRF